MFVPDSPRFRLRDLRARPPVEPPWLDDPAWLPPGSRALYATAKTGLIAVLEHWRAGGARVALLPEYLPPGVVQAVQYADFEVARYPIAADLSIPVERFRARLADVTPDVVLVVHYFGFVDPNVSAVVEVARDAGAYVIEDAARGLFGRDRDGRLLGTTGDATLFSPHKGLAVPNGGIVVAPGMALPAPRRQVAEARDLVVSAGLSTFRLLGRPPPRPGTRKRRPEAAPGPAPDERTHQLDDRVWPPAAPGWLSRSGLARADPGAVQRARRRRYDALRDRLLAVDGVTVLTPAAPDGASPHGVVVAVEAGRPVRDAAAARLARRGLPVEFFEWPLAAEPGSDRYADARRLRETLLVLPAHQQLPRRAIDPMVEEVREGIAGAGGAGAGPVDSEAGRARPRS